jgi:hypothetical protein
MQKFNKRPSAIIGAVTPHHIPALRATGIAILLGL